ncbi:MAG: AAA family ATPase [Selenomonadaceae bacterium]|nr:AAA family ATPase [Selenomonadaceae bacterium]
MPRTQVVLGFNPFHILSYKYSDILGFTEDEAEKLLIDNGVGDKMPELKKWYDGYQFGHTGIYNPWSVLKYVDKECDPSPIPRQSLCSVGGFYVGEGYSSSTPLMAGALSFASFTSVGVD